MTELRGALDNAVLGELRESVGDDPEFVAELVDDFLADAPIQLESLREAATSGDAAGATARGAHAEGQQPDVRSRRARVALPGGRGGGRTRAISMRCSPALDEIDDEWASRARGARRPRATVEPDASATR